MALIDCDECGREISDKALACPGCGAPVSVAVSGDEPPESVSKEFRPEDTQAQQQPAALPAALAPLLQQADQAYADWLAADDYFGENDTETAGANMKRVLDLFVAGAVDAGRDPGQAVAALERRFPEIPVKQIVHVANSDIRATDDRERDDRSQRHVYCSSCGVKAVDGAVVCVKCGCQLARSHTASVDDGPSGGYAVLGFFIPMVGLILYLVWKGDYPLRARSCGTGAAWGFGVSVVSYILYFAAMGLLLAAV